MLKWRTFHCICFFLYFLVEFNTFAVNFLLQIFLVYLILKECELILGRLNMLVIWVYRRPSVKTILELDLPQP